MSALRINSGVNIDKAHVKFMYNKEEQFLVNQGGVSFEQYKVE